MRIIEILLIVIGMVACQKKPIADFTTDKTEYIAGDTIVLRNVSKDSYYYQWTMPDGQTSTLPNVEYYTPSTLNDGSLTFTLDAYSKNKNRINVSQKTVSLKAAYGQLTIWSSDVVKDSITVSIDGVFAGYITKFYSVTKPDCAADGCVYKMIRVGHHSVSATRGGAKWDGFVDISRNKCSKFELQPVSLF